MYHPNSPSAPGLCVRERFSQLTSAWSYSSFESESVGSVSLNPLIDQKCSHTDTENMTPETLYVNQTSSLNRGSRCFVVGKTFKKCFYRGWLRKFQHFGGEITMTVVLDLVIKTILYTQCFQLPLCQNVYQERLWITLLCHLRSLCPYQIHPGCHVSWCNPWLIHHELSFLLPCELLTNLLLPPEDETEIPLHG